MRKERKAQLLTVAVLLLVLGIVLSRQGSVQLLQLPALPAGGLTAEKSEATPQDTIYQMLDAAREGNVAGYLALHTGQIETLLRNTIQEQSEAGFAKYLRDTNAPIKGIALQQPDLITDREAKVRVEYVYQDRNEVQQVYLEKNNGKWKIHRVDSAERIKTIVPYGTPVQ